VKTPLRLLAIALAAVSSTVATARSSYESQIVVLSVTTQAFDQWRPWEKRIPETRTVQAVVLDGSLLMTTADNLEGATVILAEKHGGPLREAARIVHLDPDVNLAILTVDKPGYFEDLQPVVLASSVPRQGSVSIVRWKSGQIEISSSRVTRIEVESTYMGALKHAFLSVETSLPDGGWAEPVFADDRLVGITYVQDGQTASVTPVDMLRAYFESVRAPQGYREFANLDVYWQPNRDPVLARALGLEGEPRGILITKVPWGSSACGALFPRDILLSLDGHAVDAAGSYEHPRYGRLRFTQIVVEGHHAGDVISGEVLRNGSKVAVRLALRAARAAADLMPIHTAGEAPPYAIEGGLVFRELNGMFLRSWGKDWDKKAPAFLRTRYDLFRTGQTPSRRRVVLLAYVFPSAYTVGYGELENLPVARINGRDVDSIDDVAEAFEHPEGEFHRIVFEPNPVRSEMVVEAGTLAATTRAILEAYRIPAALRLRENPPPDLGSLCPEHP
jgi:hypothetical protein